MEMKKEYSEFLNLLEESDAYSIMYQDTNLINKSELKVLKEFLVRNSKFNCTEDKIWEREHKDICLKMFNYIERIVIRLLFNPSPKLQKIVKSASYLLYDILITYDLEQCCIFKQKMIYVLKVKILHKYLGEEMGYTKWLEKNKVNFYIPNGNKAFNYDFDTYILNFLYLRWTKIISKFCGHDDLQQMFDDIQRLRIDIKKLKLSLKRAYVDPHNSIAVSYTYILNCLELFVIFERDGMDKDIFKRNFSGDIALACEHAKSDIELVKIYKWIGFFVILLVDGEV